MTSRLAALLDDSVRLGVCSAAAAVISVDGEVADRASRGVLATIDDDGAAIDPSDRAPVESSTRFDLASLTKVYSATALLQLVSEGALSLDGPIGDHLPSYRDDAERRAVTLRHLLSHASGLPATWDGWRAPLDDVIQQTPPGTPPFRATPLVDRQALRVDLARTPLTAPPGSRWEYACTGFNTAMLLAEAVTGREWPDLVAQTVLEPLGLLHTGFSPRANGLGETASPIVASGVAVAATEWQPELRRGVVRGDVHDEASWSLGGAAANAGLFATADDVHRFAERIRTGGDPVNRDWLWRDVLPEVIPDPAGRPPHGASLGLRIGEDWMGDAFGDARGHTGFTGTSMLIDRASGTTAILLTNRVHPSRFGPSVVPLRRAVSELAATFG